MVSSRSGGISIKGTYHRTNQDSFLTRRVGDVDVLVLSDGLGGLEHSEIGSLAACEAVIKASQNTNFDNYAPVDFISKIYNNWQELISLPENECAATCLFCIATKENVLAGQLGDGFICLLREDDGIVIYDSKDDSFENETDCLSSDFDINAWRICETPREHLKAVIMCSDGVKLCDDSRDIILSFAKDIFCEYADKSESQTQSEIKNWLSDWTGRDDKTLVYFLGSGQY
jgi:hypothetical protein